MKLRKVVPYIFMGSIGVLGALYLVALFDSILSKSRLESYKFIDIALYVASSEKALKLFLCIVIGLGMAILTLVLNDTRNYQSAQIIVTPDITIPVSAGQGQCGTAKWLDKKQYSKVFCNFSFDKNALLFLEILRFNHSDIKNELSRINIIESEINEYKRQLNETGRFSEEGQNLQSQIKLKQHELLNEQSIQRKSSDEKVCDDINSKLRGGMFNGILLQKGGLVLGKEDVKELERIYYLEEDNHTLILGATRSGKGRTIAIQTICCLGLAGESMILTDPKSELYDYTKRYLELLDYHIITIDFKNPTKSTRFNFLQPIIDCVNHNDIPGAIDATWDITSQLVGEAKGEKLWNDGEASIIAASIMAVVYDNRAYENHKYQNLVNVYYFISQMCTPIQVGNASEVPLSKYVKDLPFNHPSKGLLSVGDIAPSRTRGSFYTSALMTLKLFTNPLIADMTSVSDYDGMQVGEEKTAIFIILPDDRKTYYSLASLYVTQQYQMLSKAADLRGGRLERRTNFILDEFGNFVQIPIFPNMLTVGGGKGVRFNIFVQNFSQIEEIYGDKCARTIISNCENWIYLQTDDEATLKSLSDKLGKYTISTYSLSANHQKFSNPSSSHNISLTGRELLTSDEIKKIKRPYSLVTSRNLPAIFFSPDLSSWNFNAILGLGNEEYNRRLRLARENIRESRVVTSELELWGIWDVYIEAIQKEEKEKEDRLLQQMAEKIATQSGGMY